jgi:hypothetical protein
MGRANNNVLWPADGMRRQFVPNAALRRAMKKGDELGV